MQVLRQIASVSHDEEEGEGPPGSSCIQRAYQMLNNRIDSKYGGFGSAPKFPQPGELSNSVSNGWLACWLADWLAGWLAGWLVD